MAAVTADRLAITRASNNIVEETHSIGTAATLYVGALANFTTAGRLVSATAAASRRFAGLITEIVNESNSLLTAATGNTAGTVKAKINYGMEVLLGLKTSSRTYTNLGKSALVHTNADVGGTSVGTAGVRVVVGQIVELTASKSEAWVALRVVGDVVATA